VVPTPPAAPAVIAVELPPPVEAPAPPPPKPALEPPKAARVAVKVYPWARVFLDGKLQGVTPLPALVVAPGPHKLLLVNEQLSKNRVVELKVRAGEAREVKVSLEE
jgi:serine/threonine-protein kinase